MTRQVNTGHSTCTHLSVFTVERGHSITAEEPVHPEEMVKQKWSRSKTLFHPGLTQTSNYAKSFTL